VASAEKIRTDLNWTASLDLNAMVASAWDAWQSNPPA
jgi:UDP-glucose 4-epimerase